ncbi:MAG: methyltransferase [Niabella sp.]
MIDFYKVEQKSAIEAKHMAQIIAHGPILFQVARVLRDKKILQIIEDAKSEGISLQEIVEKSGVSEYGVRVLLEAGLGMHLVKYTDGQNFAITKTGYFILHDSLTNVNMNFVQDICYKGMFHLEEAIDTGKPAGLKELGDWPTVYHGLKDLPPQLKKSWFEYDHFFSDIAFPEVIKQIYNEKITKLLDIGGNTGKWASASATHGEDIHVTIMDLPGQTEMAEKRIRELGLGEKVSFYPCNILDESTPFPTGFDAIWMSQFLDCFSEAEIVSILERCKQSINDDGLVLILEAFWDTQRFETSAFCIQQLSIYFTAIANGNSQMYDSRVFKKCIDKAGYDIVEQIDGIGLSHTLLKCKKRK